jgi:hypothetical protein
VWFISVWILQVHFFYGLNHDYDCERERNTSHYQVTRDPLKVRLEKRAHAGAHHLDRFLRGMHAATETSGTARPYEASRGSLLVE